MAASKVGDTSGEWEDVEERKPSRYSRSTEESVSSSRSPARQRKRGGGARTVYIAASPQRRLATPQKHRTAAVSIISKPASPPPQSTSIKKEEIEEAVWVGSRSAAKYAFEILSSFFFLMKKPIAAFLTIWVLAISLNALSNQMRTVFAPLCIFPGISRSWLCSRPSGLSAGKGAAQPSMHVDFPSMVDIQSKSFEQLLDESVGGSGLALEIKKAEMATTDLVTLVKVSKLTSKDLLADALVDFVGDAKDTSRGLLKLGAKVNSAVDDILAVNDYALRTIEAPKNTGSSLMSIVWPFGNSNTNLIQSTFTQSLSVLSGALQRLVLEAEVSLHSLDKLEMQLNTVHDILAREDVHISAAQSDVLAELWTKLGMNRGQLRSFESNLRLLKELGSYRSRALAHVVGALQALHTLSADMEELRERVSAPELAGGEIPVEVHVRSIRSGIERLREGRIRASEREEEAVKKILGSV